MIKLFVLEDPPDIFVDWKTPCDCAEFERGTAGASALAGSVCLLRSGTHIAVSINLLVVLRLPQAPYRGTFIEDSKHATVCGSSPQEYCTSLGVRAHRYSMKSLGQLSVYMMRYLVCGSTMYSVQTYAE